MTESTVSERIPHRWYARPVFFAPQFLVDDLARSMTWYQKDAGQRRRVDNQLGHEAIESGWSKEERPKADARNNSFDGDRSTFRHGTCSTANRAPTDSGDKRDLLW
jgi:hypothetical protein